MSKITKWKSEKTKVKVVFRLQFHATHVPQAGWDKLFISFIPADTGKVSAKTTKAHVRNGNCKWSDPVYETTRLLQDHGSKKYDDKLYKLLVAMGSSRSSILGDAAINLADYVDAAKPVSISLPLQGCTFGTVLHVTVQLLTSKTGFREFEQQRELRERGIQLLTASGIQHKTDSKLAVFSEASKAKNGKASARVEFKSVGGFPTVEAEGEMNEDIADSIVNADGSSCTSESLYTEKHDNSSTHENDSLKSTVSGDMGHLSSNQISGLENVGISVHQLVPQGSGDWVHGWCSNASLYSDSAVVYEENSKLRTCLEAAQSSILDLKLEVSTLKSQTYDMVAETQNLAEHLVVEVASGEELARTVSALKFECTKFKDDFEKVKLYKGNNKAVAPLLHASEEVGRIGAQCGQYLSEVQNKYDQPEGNWLQNLFLLEDKIKIIKGKACLQNLESDLGLVADLESLEHLILGLRHSGQKLAHSPNTGLMTKSDLHDPVRGLPESTSLLEKTSGVSQFQKSEGIPDSSSHYTGVLSTANVKQRDSQGLFHCSSVSSSGTVELGHDIFTKMEEKINGLSKELDESRAENNNLMKKMDQMECYYETLVHQLEESQQLMHAELQEIKDAHRSCIYTIATLESQGQKLQKENDELFSRFLADKRALNFVNLELEKRALMSEMALTRLRQNYSLAVDQLLKDLETLSFQVSSMYKTNEDLDIQALTDEAQPSLKRCNGEQSEEARSSLVKFDSINTLLEDQHITKRYETWADAFLIHRHQKGLSQAKTAILESEGHMAVKARHGADDAYFNSCEVRDLKGTHKHKHYKLSRLQEDRKVDDTHLVALNRENLLDLLSSEQALLADQAVLAGGQLKVLSANNLLSCQNGEVCIPGDFSRSGPDSLISEKVEILEYQSENRELKRRMSELDFLLEKTKHSLFLQGNLQQKSENKLKDMEMADLYLEIFSLVLLETVRGAQSEIMVMQGKQDEVIKQLQQAASLKELLIAKLQDASDHVKLLQQNEAKSNVRCDELVLKYSLIENNLHDALKEKNVLIEKLNESEMRITDLVDYKHKYEACTVEKEEIRDSLEKEKWEKVNLQNEIFSLKSYLKTLKLDLDKELSIRAERERKVASFQCRLGNLRRKMYSFNENIVGGVTTINISKELDDKDIEEAFFHLEQLQQEACGKFLQLSEKKKDAENKLRHLESQITMIKEKAELDAKMLVEELEESTASSEKVNGELAEMTEKYMLATEAGKKNLQEKTKLLDELSGIKMEMQCLVKERNILTEKVSCLESAAEEHNQTKAILNDCISENKDLKFSLQSANEESMKQVKELVCLKETLRCLQDELHSVGGSKVKLETELANLASKQHTDLKRKDELEFLLEEAKVSLALKEELVEKMVHEMDEMERLNVYLEFFGLVLHETLTRTQVCSMNLKETNVELIRQLRQAIEYKELLMIKLQTALAAIEALQENVAKNMAKYDDLILQNAALEEKMHFVVEENSRFAEKFRDCEATAIESLSYRQKFDSCIAEKEKFQNLLEKENLQRVTLENEIILLNESFKTLKLILDKESSKRDDQEKLLAFLEGSLQELRRKMLFFGEGIDKTAGTDLSMALHGEDIRMIISHIEDLLHKALEKFLQFHHEKKEYEERWSIAEESLKHAETQHLLVKEKAEADVRIIITKLDESICKLEQLDLELADMTRKYKIASEMEGKHVQEKRELSAEISDLKISLQYVTEDNKNLSLEVLSLKNYIEELENYRKMFEVYTSENRSLSSSLQIAKDESIQHMRKLDCLKDRIQELRMKMFSFGGNNPVEAATDLPKDFDCQDIETTISHVEELQHKAIEKLLQCYQEKRESEEQRDFAQRSLKSAETQLFLVKEKSEMNMQVLISKLEESNAKLEQLHAELTDMSAKYKVLSEMDEKHVEENMILAAELSDLKFVLKSITEEKENVLQKLFTLENSSNEEIKNNRQILNDYILENKILLTSLQTARDESAQQIKEVNSLRGRLQELKRKMLFFGESSVIETNAIDLSRELDCHDTEEIISDIEKLQYKALEKFLQCYQKKESEEQRDLAQRSLKHAESELLLVKEKSEMDVKFLIGNRDKSSAKLEELHRELTDMTSKYMIASEIVEKLTTDNRQLSVEVSDMKVMLQSVTEEKKNLLQKIFSLENSSYEEIENHKRILDDYISDNRKLSISLQIARDESVQQLSDLNSLKENCKSLKDELQYVRKSKDEVETAFAHVKFELNEKHDQLVSFLEQKAEVVCLREQVHDLLVENSNMKGLLLHSEECQGKLREHISYAELEFFDLQNNMILAEESLLKSDIEVVFLKSQLHSEIAELCNQIAVLENHQMKLYLKLHATGMALDDQMENEAQSLEQNARLTLDLLWSRSELNMPAGGRGFKDVTNNQQNVVEFKNESEFDHLNGVVMCLEEEAEVLKSSRDELDITNIIFLTKLDELNNHITCLDEYGDELNKLRIQHSELSQRLSEEVLKTEEFRNLSIRLQELKASQVNERKTADGPPVAAQECLRIAFIREQCETKLQELKIQLHLSRKYGEELLLKLQIALDELEARKKSEAMCTRKIEELSIRVVELEAELKSLLDNMREKVKDNNQLNTELEVSRLSLICCKEEKEKLEISLRECQNQRLNLLLELTSEKEKLEACTTCQSQQGSQIYNSYNGKISTNLLNSSNNDPLHREYSEAAQALLNEETDPFPWGSPEPKGTSPENSRLLLVNKSRRADENRDDLRPANRHIQKKILFSSMERLQKELEKMKNENLSPLLDQNGHQTCMVYEEQFQREASQLNMANEQLGRIFPQFNEFLESGNALERVLALEIELAEALKSKKKDAVHFQSSFLKQHHDEEAICKSFRDINELIKDMLELKKKNATVEIELKEMHNRYSQLSVQFAEVEGERQKLVMTLKSIRTTRKAESFNPW